MVSLDSNCDAGQSWENFVSFFERFQASAAKQMRTSLFWAVMQGVVVINDRRFDKTYLSHFQGSRIN